MNRLQNLIAVIVLSGIFANHLEAQRFNGRPGQYHPAPQQQKTYPNQYSGQQQISPRQVVNNQQHWTRQITTSNRAHKFGVVPGFSKQEHTFEITNNFDYPIYLDSVRASCGCTRPHLISRVVAPGKTGEVLAKFDTRNFKGAKKATISVTIHRNKPFTEYGEIQFNVSGTIRGDVVVQPSTVAFENLTSGEDAKRVVQVLYAGNPNWKITGIQSTNPNIKISTEELQRNATKRRVDYKLILEISGDQPVGPFMDQILINTSDAKNKKLAVNINGNVRASVQVSDVNLGVLSKGQKCEKRLIVRGTKPFAIKEIKAGDDRIKFSSCSGEKTLHILSYELDTSLIGHIVSNITIETSDSSQAAKTVNFEAQVVPATFALDKAPEEAPEEE